ncbi:Tripartite tricarboxylate transporter TctA family protein [Marinovum algicola]|uniref:Tricarboxylic transport membrane protein n=1 Tax=Marinovum algicola TaxID=42444 RepID=A0A975WFK2_9RHOB|nr:tripartite tricarboxylate transporter permease [Marinovum algicola]SEK11128.1 putative tricarboxylic transport membrane protein [Marinovum algicola]SLN71185.1 Tripartite tricarboxylate transporter TctA family protein [Marinovum algicola]
MSALSDAFIQMMSFWPIFFLFLGTFLGITVGAIPGLTGSMLIALTLPLTFYMSPFNAVVLLVSMYVGSISGGLITATLLRMPGTPSNVMTTFDGYPMARAGRPGRALGLGITSSLVGGLIAAIALFTITKPLSIWATRFGPFEYFTLIMMAMVLIASVSQGSLVKGLIAGLLGMIASMPGVDPSVGQLRLTFDMHIFNGGFKLLPVLIGVFAISQILRDCLQIKNAPEKAEVDMSGVLLSFSDLRRFFGNIFRSSLIGTWVGILPGIGASIGSIIAYTTQKNISKTPEEFGNGSEEGIVASEAANNATVGGALVPLIAMGIPGSVIDAILIGGLMIHSIQPGPTLFITNGDIVYGMMISYLIANFVMWGMMTGMVRWIAKLMYLPRTFVLPVIMACCILGAFALDNTFFDIWVMLAFGVVGLLLELGRFPLGPFVIGFVLAPLAEQKLRAGLMMTNGDPSPIVTTPLPLMFTIIALILLLIPLIQTARRNRMATPKAS